MTVIYVDSVFLLNTAADYLLLLSAASLAGIPLHRIRYLLAALSGGSYAVAVFLPGMEFLAAVPVKAAVGVLLALIAYGGEARLLRLILLFLAVSCGFAGCVLGLGLLLGGIPVVNGIFYTDVNTKVLAAAFGAGYLVLTVVFRAAARHTVRGECVSVRLSLCGRISTLRALRDTGNTLRDPMSGCPVLILSAGQLSHVLPKNICGVVTAETLRRPAELLEPVRRLIPELRPRLLTYQAVGTSGGLLLAVRCDWAEIGSARYEQLLLALSPTELGIEYGALWSGEIKRGGWHGTVEPDVEVAASPVRHRTGNDSLHRRK